MEKSIFPEILQNILQTEHGLQIYVLTLDLILFLGNTLDYEGFQTMIKTVLKRRESQMLKKHNLTINVDSRMADIINSSQMVAGRFAHYLTKLVSKGRSHHLLRKKLLRDQREEKNKIEEEKEQALLSITPMRREIDELKQELQNKEKEVMEFSKDSEILRSLYDRGVIDLDGNPL